MYCFTFCCLPVCLSFCNHSIHLRFPFYFLHQETTNLLISYHSLASYLLVSFLSSYLFHRIASLSHHFLTCPRRNESPDTLNTTQFSPGNRFQKIEKRLYNQNGNQNEEWKHRLEWLYREGCYRNISLSQLQVLWMMF